MMTAIEEARFKRDGNGWLFTTANPWIIGPRHTYLVDDAQKAALLVRVRRAKYLMFAMMLPFMALLIYLFIKEPWLAKPESVLAWLGLAAMSLVFAGVAIACDYWSVRPLLRGLPRSSGKVTHRDMFRALRDAMSVRMIVIFLVIFVLSGLMQIGALAFSQRSGGLELVQLTISALFAAACVAMLITKRRAAHTPPDQAGPPIR
jgi:hypothetical protein